MGLKRSVLASCIICVLKTKNDIEVLKYLFGINWLKSRERAIAVFNLFMQQKMLFSSFYKLSTDLDWM